MSSSKFLERLTRKKIPDFGNEQLRRVLTLIDLTFLGIGSTIGVGFYVLVGNVARTIAGPAVIISFLIAGIASVFAGLCYAEFGARVPKAGSAYIYSYVCVGECVAFIIGWNLVLEYIIGASSVARGFSGYIDELANNSMSEGLRAVMPIYSDALSDYPDFLSFGLTVFISILLAVGIKESSRFNNIFSSINIVIVIYVIIAAATKIDGMHNWQITVNETMNRTWCPEPEDSRGWGEGGFSPYGFSGIMRGAATCFFGFVGFDCIATTGEEALNPSRNIPLSICVSLLVIFLAYFGMSTTITLALPYCQQDPDAALISFFEIEDMPVSKWIVSFGALFGFSASLIGVLLPLPRIIYAMANDGILFRFLARVNKRFQTPLIATLSTGFLAGVIALIFDLEALVDMMSIGTLMAYTIVAVSVMLLRYVPDEDSEPQSLMESSNPPRKNSDRSVQNYSTQDVVKQLFNAQRLQDPTTLSGSIASYATLVFCLLATLLSVLLTVLQEQLFAGEAGAIVGVSIMLLLNILNVIIIGMQPESKKKLSFKVPLVPWMPALSSLINLYLMCNLSPETWIRFAVWMGVGMPIYFFYGMFNSTEELRSKGIAVGIDNPAGPSDDKNGDLFVIPTINVQLATPMNSQPNTPKTLHTEKDKPLPISPLAKEETVKSTQSGSALTNKKDDQEATEVIEFTEIVEAGSHELQDANDNTHEICHDNDDNDISKELPLVNSKNSNSSSDQDVADVTCSSNSSDPNYVSITAILSDTEPASVIGHVQDSTDAIESEPIYATVDKATKKKPEPLDFARISDSTRSSIKSSSSAPHMPFSGTSPISPLSNSPLASRGSFPSTPISRRHPTKVLKRNASFDEIPPSSLDSPLVKRVDKFFIIPVQEPDMSDSENNTPQPSPTPTIHSESTEKKDEELLMSELRKKFGSLNSNDQDDEDMLTKKPIFTVGSDDSLENMIVSNDLPRPISPNSPRDLKRVSNKDNFFLVEGLDTIRERGESKIIPDDELVHIKSEINESKSTHADETATGNSIPETDIHNESNVPNSQEKTPSEEKIEEDIMNTIQKQSQLPSTSHDTISDNENVNKLKSLFGSKS